MCEVTQLLPPDFFFFYKDAKNIGGENVVSSAIGDWKK